MNAMGELIAARRKELGMTQKEVAAKLNVTDKAVSKWERGIAFPDIQSIPLLAEALEMSVVELMDAQEGPKEEEAPMKQTFRAMLELILKVIPLAMGVAVAALSAMKQLEVNAGLTMLGIGLFCMALGNLSEKE